jgi:excisionase family DNA binding protein
MVMAAWRGQISAVMKYTTAPLGALKIKDAAAYLGGVSTITVRRLIKRGLIKPNRALRHLLIPVAELDRFVTGEGRQVR